MSVGEFTASNIAVDQDKKDEEAKKRTNIDYSKIEATVSSNKELASRVYFSLTHVFPLCLLQEHQAHELTSNLCKS